MIAYESKMKIFEEIRYFLMFYLNLDFILHWVLVLLISPNFSFQSFRRNFSRTFILILNHFASAVVDPRGVPPACPLPPPKISQFHAVFRRIWQNRMLVPPFPEGWRPLLQGIMDPPLICTLFEVHTVFTCNPLQINDRE